MTHWFPLPLLRSPFPAAISPARFGFGLDEGSATLLCSRRKEARIAQEVAAIFQPLEFFHSHHLILCPGLVLPLQFGFARVHFLKTENPNDIYAEYLLYTEVIPYIDTISALHYIRKITYWNK